MTRLQIAALALALAAPPAAAAAPRPGSDPAAVAVAQDVMRALGGEARWNALPGLRWTFGVASHDSVKSSRRHAWDKLTGRHRVQGTFKDGRTYVVVHTVGDTLHGAAWVAGRAVRGDSLHTLVKMANAMWVNDTYWFLMPYKLLDPGVHLRSDGTVRDSAGTFERIELTFDHVGLTPGDHYWVDVNARTKRVERWQFVLQGMKPPPSHWTWQGWEQHDGLWFPTRHVQGALTLFTNDVQTVRSFGPHEFTAP